MRLFGRSKFEVSRKVPRRRQLVNLLRNVWVLRRDLWSIFIRRERPARDEGIALVCIACGHDLTKPCVRGRWKHVVRWPAEADGLGDHQAGELVEIARQKPRGGEYEKDYDLGALR